MRSYSKPSSPQHQSTFWTLIELARPQIFNISIEPWSICSKQKPRAARQSSRESGRKLVREHRRLADLRRNGKQIGRVGHQRRRDRAVQVRRPSGFIIECVKNREGRLVKAQGKPCDSAGLCHDETARIREKRRDILLPARFCLQLKVEREARHRTTPFALLVIAIIYLRGGLLFPPRVPNGLERLRRVPA